MLINQWKFLVWANSEHFPRVQVKCGITEKQIPPKYVVNFSHMSSDFKGKFLR